MHPRYLMATAAVAALTVCSAAAQDLDARPSWYVQAGKGESSSYALVLGTTMPWKNWQWNLGSGKVRGHWDAWVGAWSNQGLDRDRFTTSALGIGPSLRWRGAQGTAAWFVEAGTAVMVTGKRLVNSGERMGTRFNFASHIGFGVNFGAQHAQELSLRLQHASNAGIKDPNPGLDLVQIRYARAF